MTARTSNKANTARAPVKAKVVKAQKISRKAAGAHETAKEPSARFPIVGIVQGFLAKPYELHELLERVGHLMHTTEGGSR
jgi:hypothetical protein